MGERRLYKLQWHVEDENEYLPVIREHNSSTRNRSYYRYDCGCYHAFPESRMVPGELRDHSEWTSYVSIEEASISSPHCNFENIYEAKKMIGGERHYRETSPGFDGMELDTYNRTHATDHRHSQRYLGRGRSRSRSREGGWNRSRSRSASGAKGYTRMCSRPMGDYRQPAYEWCDGSSCEKSSPILTNFAAGRHNKSSKCICSHPSDASCGDRDFMEFDTVESLRSGPDLSHTPKYSYRRYPGSKSLDAAANPYYREGEGEDEEERFINRNRPCKSFMRGNCRWGDDCRFQHAISSDPFDQGTRKESFDEYISSQPYRKGKPPCKYYAAGKCDRDNCRFPHEDPNLNNQEKRLRMTADGSSSYRRGQRNGPTWTRISDISGPTGWGETNVTSTTTGADIDYVQIDDKGGHSLVNKNKSWGCSVRTSRPLDSQQQPFTRTRESGSYDRDATAAEATVKENTSSSKYIDCQPYRKGSKPLCKYFVAGKCDRYHCRFRHENPNLYLDDRLDNWDPCGRGDSNVDITTIVDGSDNRQNDHKGSQNLEIEKNNCVTLEHEPSPLNNWKRPFLTEGSDNGRDATASVHTAKKNAYFGRNKDRGPYRKVKLLCKYFAAGKCDRDNCRFLHKDPNPNKLENEPGIVTDSGSSHNRSKSCNWPTWDLPTKTSETPYPNGWGETRATEIDGNNQKDDKVCKKLENGSGIVTDSGSSHSRSKSCNWPTWDLPKKTSDTPYPNGWGETSATSPTTDRDGNNQNDDKVCNSLDYRSSNLNSQKRASLAGESDYLDKDITATGSHVKENMASKQEHLKSPALWLQNRDGIENAHRRNEMQENQSREVLNRNVYLASYIQEPHFESQVIEEVKSTKCIARPNLLYGESSNQNGGSMFLGHSSLFKESDGTQNNVCTSLSSDRCLDSKEPETNKVGPLNLQTLVQNNQNSVQSPGLIEARVIQILTNFLAREQSKRAASQQLSQDTNAVALTETVPTIEASNSMVMLQSVSNVSSLAQENSIPVSLDLFSSVENVKDETKCSTQEPAQNNENDEKVMRMFKNCLVEFVKEILIPTWKEGRMSRDVFKAVVKKVVDKIFSTIQVVHIPKTQDKVEEYLSHSKPNIAKLVQAYIEHFQKVES